MGCPRARFWALTRAIAPKTHSVTIKNFIFRDLVRLADNSKLSWLCGLSLIFIVKFNRCHRWGGWWTQIIMKWLVFFMQLKWTHIWMNVFSISFWLCQITVRSKLQWNEFLLYASLLCLFTHTCESIAGHVSKYFQPFWSNLTRMSHLHAS